MMEYLRWANDHEPGNCVVRIPVVDNASLINGNSLKGAWPDDVATQMKDDYPDDTKLTDNLAGSYHPIVSEKIANILKSELDEECLELLPIKVLDHDGNQVETPYFMVHPLVLIDCIDIEASDVEWNEFEPETILDCMGLEFKDGAIPNDAKLFRLKHWGSKIIIRSDLVEILESAGCAGLYFPEAEGYDGIG